MPKRERRCYPTNYSTDLTDAQWAPAPAWGAQTARCCSSPSAHMFCTVAKSVQPNAAVSGRGDPMRASGPLHRVVGRLLRRLRELHRNPVRPKGSKNLSSALTRA
jgi:hypothetical protein